MPARESTPRVSIAQVRGHLAPRIYRATNSVRLEHGGVACDVALVTVPAHGSVTAPQRRLGCPRCKRAVLVLGVVGDGWCCVRCGRWRSRDRSRSIKHTTPVDVGDDGSGRLRADEIASPKEPAELDRDREQKRVALAAALNEHWDRVGLAPGDRPSFLAREVHADLAPGDDADRQIEMDSLDDHAR